MTMRKAHWMTGVVSAAIFAVATAGTAQAQTAAGCESTEFSSKTGELYLAAETELLQNDNPAGALNELNKLRNMELNCYENAAVLRLSAAIKIENGDAAGAVRDLEAAINAGAITGKDIPQTYYNIAQLYLQQDNLEKSREYMQKWLNSPGVTPTRDQNFQMAVLYQKLEDYKAALPYAERVLRADGQNADRQIIDFLIFLYDRTGDKAKKAELLQRLLQRDPNDRKVWDAIAGDYFQGNEERKAFEVQKAMYLAGLLKEEQEIMRVVNFYNRFNAPYEAAKILEKEINRGRVSKTFERLELLANLYQVAREYEKAVPVIRQAAQMTNNGQMYERLGRSYFELGDYEEAIDAYRQAIAKGNLKEPGYARVMIGQANYELDNVPAAEESFRDAANFADGRRAANGWLGFLRAEREGERAFARFEVSTRLEGLRNEKKSCEQLKVLGDNLPEGCSTVDERIKAVEAELAEMG
tara:strand:- start:20 stop:1429 length:1410 start_codon:yes stop_codon:yes gene_type:complete